MCPLLMIKNVTLYIKEKQSFLIDMNALIKCFIFFFPDPIPLPNSTCSRLYSDNQTETWSHLGFLVNLFKEGLGVQQVCLTQNIGIQGQFLNVRQWRVPCCHNSGCWWTLVNTQIRLFQIKCRKHTVPIKSCQQVHEPDSSGQQLPIVGGNESVRYLVSLILLSYLILLNSFSYSPCWT